MAIRRYPKGDPRTSYDPLLVEDDHFRVGDQVVSIILDEQMPATVIDGGRAEYWGGPTVGKSFFSVGVMSSGEVRHAEGHGCGLCDQDRPKLIAWHQAHAPAWRYAEKLAGWKLPYDLQGSGVWAQGSLRPGKWEPFAAALDWPTLFAEHPNWFEPVHPGQWGFTGRSLAWDRADVTAAYDQYHRGEGGCPSSVVEVFYSGAGALRISLWKLSISGLGQP